MENVKCTGSYKPVGLELMITDVCDYIMNFLL